MAMTLINIQNSNFYQDIKNMFELVLWKYFVILQKIEIYFQQQMQCNENKLKALDYIRNKYQSKTNISNTFRAQASTACTTPRKISPFRYDTALKNVNKSIEKIKIKQLITMKEEIPFQKKGGIICKNIKKNVGTTSQQKIKFLSKKYQHNPQKYLANQDQQFLKQNIFTKTTPRPMHFKNNKKLQQTINKKNSPFFSNKQIYIQASNTEPTYHKLTNQKQRVLQTKQQNKNGQAFDDCMKCIQNIQNVYYKIRGVLKQE